MDTFSSFPRRLTQLYTDTKTSCNAVVEQGKPGTQLEVNSLHRKFRIEKDRFDAWGLQWSDSTKGRPDDIAENLERAGLADRVTGIMGVIKEILDEAERMHPPAVHVNIKTMSEKGGRPSDNPTWAASDRSRYEDLATDLTKSIDILYDLSRSRQPHREGYRGLSPDAKVSSFPPRPSLSTSVYSSADYSASDLTLINPATLPTNTPVPTDDLPPKLSPSDLVLPEEEPPPYESIGVFTSIRVIGKLRRPHSSTNPWKTDGNKTIEQPVLVEYAAFDPTYRLTKVSPSLDRLERLLYILRRLSNEQSYHGTLTCLGYFEDPKQPRFGLVFELPSFVYSGVADSQRSIEELRPVTLLSVLQTGSKSQHSPNSATPPLEDRFRLAFTLAFTFNKIHGDNFAHKDVNSSNILVFEKNRRQSPNSKALQYALRSPVICSFDLFSNYNISTTGTMPLNIYRHPEDPQFTGEKDREYGPQFDLYGLGLILLEIGLWLPLSDLWKARYTLEDFKQRVEDVYIRRLASKCGTAYMQAVRDCFSAANRTASGSENVMQLYERICLRLQKCCQIDELEPSLEYSQASAGVPLAGGEAQRANLALKRKSVNSTQTTELTSNPSHRSAKRWALEKGTEVLERTRSLSKSSPLNSPNLSSISQHGSARSQSSIRKSISQLISPREEPTDSMDWRPTQSRAAFEGFGILSDSAIEIATPASYADRHEPYTPQRDEVDAAASTIQRAWRASQTQPTAPPRSSGITTFRDYKEKITIIQKAWRKRKAVRTNTIHALLAVSTPPAVLGYTPQRGLPYPTPEPEPQIQSVELTPEIDRYTASIQIQADQETLLRPKLRLHPVKFSPEIVTEWHETLLPRLERLIERALKDSDETISIDLVSIGETPVTARRTILVTCSSVSKVRSILTRRFHYDKTLYDLRVRRGKVRRSKMNRPSRRRRLPHRSMMNTDIYNGDMTVMNPYHQQRPLCGASIGAFRGEHLPPVSFGGVILVDDEPMGMSVHHLLDAPSDDDSDSEDEAISPRTHGASLSSAPRSGAPGSPYPMWDIEMSDDGEFKTDDEDAESFDFSDSEMELTSDYESDEELAQSATSISTTGDIDGIPLGEGDEIKITQPAIDDIDDDFFPNEEDRDDDHLSSHELGYVHASSGIRRWKRDGVVHEIDWALLKLKPDRLQPYNLVQGGRIFSSKSTIEQDQREISSKLESPVNRRNYSPEQDEYPNGVTSADNLGGLSVHCFGRTTGLQGGMVGSAMSSVRIYRRKTFSRSWHVQGSFGVGGDSGAWVIQNSSHRVVGHVLAWCERNRIAYICPMEVLLEDIQRTIGASRIYLPGSAEQAKHLARSNGKTLPPLPMHHSQKDGKMEDLEFAVERLGIVDSVVDMTQALRASQRKNRLDLPPLNTSGELDKENLGVVRSRMLRMKEGRGGQQLGMVGVP